MLNLDKKKTFRRLFKQIRLTISIDTRFIFNISPSYKREEFKNIPLLANRNIDWFFILYFRYCCKMSVKFDTEI